jgi:DNA-directed RNA polymerase specialized sigma24 family protein
MEHGEDAIRTWRREGLSYAEIGRRLGVSADRIREILGDETPEGFKEIDDNAPNTQPVR